MEVVAGISAVFLWIEKVVCAGHESCMAGLACRDWLEEMDAGTGGGKKDSQGLNFEEIPPHR